MSRHWEEYWRFDTENIQVLFEITDCDDPPYDWMDKEIADDIISGKYNWFDARIRVITQCGQELGSDYLSGCSYNSVDEFISSHRSRDPMNRNCTIMRKANGDNMSICHYFPSMVYEAVAMARESLKSLKSIPVRTA